MTTQQKLQIVSERIRQDIPRLMKPAEGCLVIHRNTLIKILYEDGNHYKAVTVEWNEPKPWILDKDVEYKIIGHEIMLNDWFEWLLNINPDLYYFAIEGNVLAVYEETEHVKDILINISKPYLKDQPEELITFLYDLTRIEIN